MLDPVALCECVAALRRRRMLGTFGAWRGIDIEREADDQLRWKLAGSLDQVTNAAAGGEPWAVALLRMLNRKVRIARHAIRFDTIPSESNGPAERPRGPDG